MITVTILVLIPLQKNIDKRIVDIKKQTIKIIEQKIHRKIAYSSLSPSLFMYMEFRDFSVMDNNKKLININRIRIYYNFRELLSGRPLYSLKEIRIVKSNFVFNTLIDKDLIELYKNFIGKGSANINFPDIKISGKKLKIKLTNGSDTIGITRLFFVIDHVRNKTDFTFKGILRTNITKLKSLSGSTRFSITGTQKANMEFSNTLIALKSLDNQYLNMDKLTFYADYKSGVLTLQKVEDDSPLDLKISYANKNKILKANFNSENFIPLDYITVKKVDPSILQWLGTAISGTGELAYSLGNTDLTYSASVKIQTNNKSLPVQAAINTSFVGDKSIVSFSKLNIKTKNGAIFFRGKLTYSNWLPSGEVSVLYNFAAMDLDADIIVSNNKNNLQIKSSKFIINSVEFHKFHSNILFFKKDIDFTTTLSMAQDESNSDTGVISINGNLQYSPDVFLNLTMDTTGTPINRIIKNIPSNIKSYYSLLPQLKLTSELFFSTNFKQYSFSGSNIKIFSNNNDEIKFSISGNNESVGINDLSANLMNRNLTGSIKTKKSSRSISTIADLTFEGLPYNLNLQYFPGVGVFFDGMYGLKGSYSKTGNSTEYTFSLKDFPIPNNNDITKISLNTNGFYTNPNNWQAKISNLSVSNIPGMIPGNILTLDGTALNNKITLNQINFIDTLSELSGSGEINYDMFNKKMDGSIRLKSSDGETYDGSVSFINNLVDLKIDFAKAPLNRFRNIPVTGLLNGNFSLIGPFKKPNIKMSIRLDKGNFNSSPLEMETTIDLTDKKFQLSYLRLKYKDQILQKGNGEYNFLNGKFFVNTEYSGIINKKRIKALVGMEGKSNLIKSRPSVSEILDNNFDAEFLFDRILIDNKPSALWNFQIKQEKNKITFHGGPQDGVSGVIEDRNRFSILSGNGLPVRGEAIGSIVNDKLNLSLNNLEVDLPLINLIPMGGFFKFTGGTAYGSLNISGKLVNPVFNGTLHAVEAKANVPIVPEEIEKFDADIIFKDRNMVIGPKILHIGNSSVKIATNFIIDKWIPGTFKVDINTLDQDRLPILYDISSIGLGLDGYVNGNFSINGDTDGIYINSNLIVNDCTISLGPIVPKDKVLTKPLFMNMKFTSDHNVEFLWPSRTIPILRATADPGQIIKFNMDSQSATYSLIGDVNIKYGTITYFQKSFYLSEGSIIFNENESKFDPLLAFRAQIKEVDSEGKVVNISLIQDKMPVSKFSPRVESEPPLSDVEIFSLLGSGVFAQIGNEQIDLTSALLLTSDLVTQFGIIRTFENKVKNVFKLDLFSIRTQMIQNILIDRFVGNNTTDSGVYLDSFGRYLDNTNLYLGKYFGDDIFIQGQLQISNQRVLNDGLLYSTNKLFFESTISLEWQTPLFLLGISVKPDFIDPLASIQNTSLELSWGYSY